jgi:hypothetical protein
MGIVADQIGFEGISYGHVWPGEVVVNLGTSVLMAAWVQRSLRYRQERAATPPQATT